jgi:hypothetical protein
MCWLLTHNGNADRQHTDIPIPLLFLEDVHLVLQVLLDTGAPMPYTVADPNVLAKTSY